MESKVDCSSRYLEFRQKLKEEIRRRMRKESGGGDEADQKSLPSEGSFGSFFGPSQTCIAQRLIQECQFPLKNDQSTMGSVKALGSKVSSAGKGSKGGERKKQMQQPPKLAVDARTLRFQSLSERRDYSFLYSDGAEPAPLAAVAKVPSTAGPLSNGGQRSVANQGSNKPTSVSKLRSMPPESRLRMRNNTNSSRTNASTKKATTEPAARGLISRKNSSTAAAPEKKAPRSKAGPKIEPFPAEQLVWQKGIKQTQRAALSVPKGQATLPKPEVMKKPTAPVVKKSSSHSTVEQDRLPKKGPAVLLSDNEEEDDDFVMPSDEEDDYERARREIRKMFKTDRFKSHHDRDSGDMEAGFHQILKEEKRSAMLARKEDQEQLRLIQEEELRERQKRKLGKKPKLSHDNE